MFDKMMVRGSTAAAFRFLGGVLILLGLVATDVHAQTLTVLASFNVSNGANPFAGLTLNGNALYGTTEDGGANYEGTVFSVPLSGGSPTVLASFNGSNGEGPGAGLTLWGNTLYGTTPVGGANNDGTVFSVPVSGGSPTVWLVQRQQRQISPSGLDAQRQHPVWGDLSGRSLMGTARSSAFP